MPIRNIDISRLSRLSRLEIKPQEEKPLRNDLEKIINYFDILDEINYPDKSAPANKKSVKVENLREDKIGKSLAPDEVFKNAPEGDGSFFRVPRILPGPGDKK